MEEIDSVPVVEAPSVDETTSVEATPVDESPSVEATPVDETQSVDPAADFIAESKAEVEKIEESPKTDVPTEADKITLWRQEQQERIAKKDQEEEIQKKKWKEEAKQELEDWYKKRDEQLKKTFASHK